jgi:hypothetical protein
MSNNYLNDPGSIMVHIDPLALVEQTPLRCFGEEYQDKLARFLKIFLLLGEFEGAPPPQEKTKNPWPEPKIRCVST